MIPSPVAVVGIGASAGGLQAYTEFLEAIPPNTGMAFVIVQHLAAEHESLLATLLARVTSMTVIEVHDEPRLEPNHIYVIPPNRSMLILDGKLSLVDRAPGIHRPVDIFLEALAESSRSSCNRRRPIRDGQRRHDGGASDQGGGRDHIRARRDRRALRDAEKRHQLRLRRLRAVRHGTLRSRLPGLQATSDLAFDSGGDDAPGRIDEIVDLLRQKLNVDFSQYKINTLHRRIRRRMSLRKTGSA